MTQAEKKAIRSKIAQRRCQILIHSIIYYRMNDNIISDAKWSQWALELETLQSQYPTLSKQVKFLYEDFKDFDHSTGQNLPLDDEWAVAKAEWLLAHVTR